MHVVLVNYTYNRLLTTPEALLERYDTLGGWARALASAGARVSVVPRFGCDTDLTRDGIVYRFVLDPGSRHGGLLDRPHRIHRAIEGLEPDIVHVHGLQFARQARQLKRLLESRGSDAPIVLQDHANAPPRRWLHRWTLGFALRRVDAVSFVSREQARPWQEGGFLRPEQRIVELMEGSSRFSLEARARARARTGLTGDPVCLWVGRLNANKDPLTVLDGFRRALDKMPRARLAMIYGSEDLLPVLDRWLAENPSTQARVRLLGLQPHRALEAFYNSSDFFLLGSHHEGSGFAVLEALACGVVPVLSDIPSFRVLTGRGGIGGLWPVGDAEALATVLTARYSRLHGRTPDEVRAFFDEHFSWEAIGRRGMAVYREIIDGRRGRSHS